MKNAVLQQLDLVEQQFNEVSALLAAGNADQLEAASAALQALAVEMLQAMGGNARKHLRTPEVVQRIREVSAGIGLLRDNLGRRSALVNQALAIVIPVEAGSTYTPGAGVYGKPAPQSGAFKYLAA